MYIIYFISPISLTLLFGNQIRFLQTTRPANLKDPGETIVLDDDDVGSASPSLSITPVKKFSTKSKVRAELQLVLGTVFGHISQTSMHNPFMEEFLEDNVLVLNNTFVLLRM
jgi:hypothetical protein